MNFDNLINQANQALANNDIPKAIDFFKEALNINETSNEICIKLGILTLKIGDIKSSIEYFNKSIKLDPNSPQAFSNLGLIYLQLKNKDLSLKNFLKSLELNPDNFNTNYNLANYFFFYNDFENAEKYYLISINLNPKNFLPYNNLFQIYDRSNHLKKLDQLILKIINIFGNNKYVKFLQGLAEFRKKNYQKTIEILKDLEFDSNDFQRNSLKANIIAKCYDYIGLYSEAFKQFSLSNETIYKSHDKKFSKNNYKHLVNKRLNYFSNDFSKFDFDKTSYDKFNDPVFLIGFPRSGTTLLDTILRTHKSINVMEEKPFVEELVNDLNKHIDQDLKNLSKLKKNSIIELRKIYFKKLNDLVNLDNKFVIIDKLPLNIIYVAELNRIFPKAKFILCLRNPYDVVLSCFMQSFVPNDAMSNFYNLKDASELYDSVMKLWTNYENILTLNKHVVKYEDVVNNFDVTIKSLLNFLNLEWSDELRKFYITAEKRGIINTPSYNQINMPLYNKSISRWKNYSDKFSDVSFILDKWIKIFQY